MMVLAQNYDSNRRSISDVNLSSFRVFADIGSVPAKNMVRAPATLEKLFLGNFEESSANEYGWKVEDSELYTPQRRIVYLEKDVDADGVMHPSIRYFMSGRWLTLKEILAVLQEKI